VFLNKRKKREMRENQRPMEGSKLGAPWNEFGAWWSMGKHLCLMANGRFQAW